MLKTCRKCNQEYDSKDGFYPGNAKCKNCIRQRSKDFYYKYKQDPEWVERERKRARLKVRKKRHKVTPKKKKEYLINYPEKYKGQTAIQHFAKKVGFHLHHWSYNDEHLKDVIELTSKHHNKAHRFLVYDQERKMYRTMGGVLLDTKERHTEYILNKIQNEID